MGYHRCTSPAQGSAIFPADFFHTWLILHLEFFFLSAVSCGTSFIRLLLRFFCLFFVHVLVSCLHPVSSNNYHGSYSGVMLDFLFHLCVLVIFRALRIRIFINPQQSRFKWGRMLWKNDYRVFGALRLMKYFGLYFQVPNMFCVIFVKQQIFFLLSTTASRSPQIHTDRIAFTV